MLRLRSSILTHISSSPATSHAPSLHRLISAAAAATSRSPRFAVEDYLVDTCGLTPAQALKASTKISHLKSPSRPDAVLAFLAGLGLSAADVAAVVAKDPRLLCASVEKTLAPNVAGLAGLGFSRPELARLVLLGRESFRSRSVVPRLRGYLPLFGSSGNLLRAVVFNTSLLAYDPERTVKRNLAFLRERGLGACEIAKLCCAVPRMLTASTERVREMVACAKAVGAPVGSPMFKHAMRAVAFLTEEKIAARVEFLKKTCRWSDADVGVALSKSPAVLTSSEEKLRRSSEFLISEVGLLPAYTAHRPAMLSYSLEGRLRPRYYVVKFLKANGLLERDRSYYSAVMRTEKVFGDKYIRPHKEAAPHLAQDYADACKGLVVPTRFRFESTKKTWY